MTLHTGISPVNKVITYYKWPDGQSVGVVIRGYGHAVREVEGSYPGLDTIVGEVLQLARQLARFSAPWNMLYILNSKFIQN